MPSYISQCPNCGSNKNDISWLAAYFDVYECQRCNQKFCYHCPGSNGGRECPHCGSTDYRTYGRVSKP